MIVADGSGTSTTLYVRGVEVRNYGQGANEIVTRHLTGDIRQVNGVMGTLVTDHLGSTLLVTDDQGLPARETAYAPYGQIADEAVLNASVETETIGYIGERYDEDAGLQYLNARYYDPALGLFIQPDWWEVTWSGVGMNRYAYSLGDPVNLMDPGGNDAVWQNSDGSWSSSDGTTIDLSTGETSYDIEEDQYAHLVDDGIWSDAVYDPAINLDLPSSGRDRVITVNDGGVSESRLYRPGSSFDTGFGGLEYESAARIVQSQMPGASIARMVFDVSVSSLGIGVSAPPAITATTTSVAARSTALVVRPHGNSKLSVQPQSVYELIDKAGRVVKIGITETAKLASRYSTKWRRQNGLRIVERHRIDGRAVGYGVERARIIGHEQAIGSIPRLNSGYR